MTTSFTGGVCPTSEEIVAFVEGRLAGERVAFLERHVDDCPVCPMLVAAAAGQLTLSGTHGRTASSHTLVHGIPIRRLSLPEPGVCVGRYRLESPIGSGGMGDVYLAADPHLRRKVALKRLRRTALFAGDRNRIIREAQAMAKLSHPNVLPVFDVGVQDDQVFIAMHYARGGTLRQWLEERQRPIPEILERFLAAGHGLVAAHAHDLVHRDFKPDNVLFDVIENRHHVFVADFGLARDAGDRRPSFQATAGEPSNPLRTSTRTGSILGTPAYMAPEQHAGEMAGPAADQYAFCVALWEALYGARPFDAPTLGELYRRKQHRILPVPARDRRVPRPLHALLEKGLSPAPGDRHASLELLLIELGRQRHRPSRRMVVVAATAVAFAGMAPSSDSACERTSGAISSTWDASAKHAIADGFAATRMPFASQTATAVQAKVERYVDDWKRTRQRLCAAGENDSEFDRRMHCLARHHDRLRATIAALKLPTPDLVERAKESLDDALADPVGCVDSPIASLDMDAFDSPDLSSNLVAVRAWIDEARAQRFAGRFERASELEEQALARVRQHPEARQQLADLLVDHAHTRGNLGAHDEVEALAEEAFFLSLAGDHVPLALEAAVQVARVNAQSGFLAEAKRWARHAKALLVRGGSRLQDEREVTGLMTMIAFYERDGDEALASARRYVELSRLLHGDGLRLAAALEGQALVENMMGRYEAARASNAAVLAIRKRELPPEHPAIAETLYLMGEILRAQGDTRDATAFLRQALAIRERTLPATHGKIGDTLTALAALQPAREAIPFTRRALEIARANHGDEHTAVAQATQVLGSTLLDAGDIDEAEILLERAASLRTRLLGQEHPDRMWDLVSLSALHTKRLRRQRAIETAREAVELAEDGFGPDHDFFGWSLLVLAEAEFFAGDASAACDTVERSIEVLIAARGEDDLEVDEARNLRARCLTASGRATRAAALLEQRLARAAEPSTDPERAMRVRLEGELARAYSALHRKRDATAMAARAARTAATLDVALREELIADMTDLLTKRT